jgi:branched-chain amino acid transport system permease protein
MSDALQFYISTVLVYLAVDVIACWGLNLQFGVAGLLNFAFIVFQAAGAYTAAILTLGPQEKTGFVTKGFQHYILGANVAFPIPFLAAAAVGAVLSLFVGLLVLRNLRSDYQGVVMLVVSIIATTIVQNDEGLFNGTAGLSLIPAPLFDQLGLSFLEYQWFYVGLSFVLCVIVYFVVHRIMQSPVGRVLRAIRENDAAAAALGKNVAVYRMFAFVVGGAIAALSGALLAQFIGAWSTGSWLYPETFVVFTAVIIGGKGNNLGVMVGALLVPVAFTEATRFLPPIGRPGLIDALQWIAIGILIMIFLYFRPQGVIAERKHRFPRLGESPSVWVKINPLTWGRSRS